MRIRAFAFIAAALIAGAPLGAAAGEHTVSIKGKVFSPRALNIRPGDTIRFVNEDTVSHHVYSLTPGHLFTSGRRAPGRHAVFVFNRPGAFEVIGAAQYERMKLQVEVVSR